MVIGSKARVVAANLLTFGLENHGVYHKLILLNENVKEFVERLYKKLDILAIFLLIPEVSSYKLQVIRPMDILPVEDNSIIWFQEIFTSWIHYRFGKFFWWHLP